MELCANYFHGIKAEVCCDNPKPKLREIDRHVQRQEESLELSSARRHN
jgi:hypothetical protein